MRFGVACRHVHAFEFRRRTLPAQHLKPACLNPIQRGELKVAKPFPCPHCQRLVQTSISFRTLLFLSCYGIPAILVYRFHTRVWIDLAIWLILSFVSAMFFSVIATATHPAPLILPRPKREDFQSMGL
jgi:hypothetical protein